MPALLELPVGARKDTVKILPLWSLPLFQQFILAFSLLPLFEANKNDAEKNDNLLDKIFV